MPPALIVLDILLSCRKKHSLFQRSPQHLRAWALLKRATFVWWIESFINTQKPPIQGSGALLSSRDDGTV